MSVPFVSLCCEPRRKLYGSQSWTDHRHEATADGSSGSISVATTKLRNELPQPDRHGSMREAQACLTKKLRERDLGRDLEGAKITPNEYLDRWLETAVKPRVRQKTCRDYD